jgi:hypothetical protein
VPVQYGPWAGWVRAGPESGWAGLKMLRYSVHALGVYLIFYSSLASKGSLGRFSSPTKV